MKLNSEWILSQFLRQREYKDETTGEHISKRKRMDEMYNVITDSHYNHSFTKEEKLFALELLKQIINE